MKQNIPISIRVVQNGYIVTTQEHKPYMAVASDGEHVFTTATDLAAFVAQFYAENHPSPLANLRKAIHAHEAAENDEVHNPDNLSDEVIGVADGWRLLRKSEVNYNRNTIDKNIEQWHEHKGEWDDDGYFGCEKGSTYRTKVPFGQLDAEGASK